MVQIAVLVYMVLKAYQLFRGNLWKADLRCCVLWLSIRNLKQNKTIHLKKYMIRIHLCLSLQKVWLSNSSVQPAWGTQERMTKRGQGQKSSVMLSNRPLPVISKPPRNKSQRSVCLFFSFKTKEFCYIFRLSQICYNSFWETKSIESTSKQITSIKQLSHLIFWFLKPYY